MAARWAASSYNEQPWSYLLATRENPPEFARLLSCLVEANCPQLVRPAAGSSDPRRWNGRDEPERNGAMPQGESS